MNRPPMSLLTIIRRASVIALLLCALGCRGVTAPQPTLALKPVELNPDFTKPLAPSNNRDWTPDQAVMPWAEIDGQRMTVHNIRRCEYRSADDYDVAWFDQAFDLERLESVDFIVVPFNDLPGVAHTMLSFGFDDGQQLGVSVEIRKERGEAYSPVRGFLRQYELMYVVADEQDLILKQALHYLCDVYVYRSTATPAQARDLLVDVMGRANELRRKPEFYNTLTNNCTTNIRQHVNRLVPGRVPYDWRVLLPGYSDRMAYDLGLIRSVGSFADTRARAKVNYLAYRHESAPDFSRKIRR